MNRLNNAGRSCQQSSLKWNYWRLDLHLLNITSSLDYQYHLTSELATRWQYIQYSYIYIYIYICSYLVCYESKLHQKIINWYQDHILSSYLSSSAYLLICHSLCTSGNSGIYPYDRMFTKLSSFTHTFSKLLTLKLCLQRPLCEDKRATCAEKCDFYRIAVLVWTES